MSPAANSLATARANVLPAAARKASRRLTQFYDDALEPVRSPIDAIFNSCRSSPASAQPADARRIGERARFRPLGGWPQSEAAHAGRLSRA